MVSLSAFIESFRNDDNTEILDVILEGHSVIFETGYVGKISGNFNNWHTDKEKIAKNLFKIRHWNILLGSYEDIPNQEATWFIDPPYQHVTRRNYKHSKMDYDHLAQYCQDRMGQVIVCENAEATWLPFTKLIDMHGLVKWTNEAIWIK